MFILTIRNDGLGDLILALPTLGMLRRRYPEARLGVVVAASQAPLFELYPDAIDVWLDQPEFRRRLRTQRPDVALFLRPDPHWAAAAWMARVPRRIGTRHRWQSIFFNERLDLHRKEGGRHEAQCNLLVASALGKEERWLMPHLRVPEHYLERGRSFRAERGFDWKTPYVVLHPGSHGSSPNWSKARYAELADTLTADGVRVLVTGGTSEALLARDVAGARGCAAGETDLGTLAAHLCDASAIVSSSTGPMHLAAALNVPVVALFSSQRSHAPTRWGPLGEGHVVLLAAPSVADGSEATLAAISVAEVAGRLARLLETRRELR